MRNILAAASLAVAALTALPAVAADAPQKSVAAVHQEKAALAGKTVSVQGKVVKVNNGIMGRNFVHVQDGSGDAAAGSNNLIVTSKDTAQVGQQVAVSGKVTLNRDFGAGYLYPLLLEEASIAVK
ncbi:hypothetical protein [Azospira restricta]|uniref:Nucleotide-binding protein n=1 Tax=Azospira restricta TaxID=404405 RepID=A0A974SPJ9_9RHOO|nr:hypothetical protein [Azospira restricta]QRJ64097.1 hypothetical protein IWH25_01705 [Azospira restricta]